MVLVKYFLGNKRSSTEIMVVKVSVEDVGVHKKRKRMVFCMYKETEPFRPYDEYAKIVLGLKRSHQEFN